MHRDPNATGEHLAGENPSTHTHVADPNVTGTAAFEAGLTPGGWSQPPRLRQDPSSCEPDVHPLAVPLPVGERNRFQIEGEIARGGMGVILRGFDPDLGRDLAIKVLKAELASKPLTVQRFVDEAQICGQLQHPGIVPVYDIGRFEDGRPYFAMKLVRGRTLADLLEERKSPLIDRARFIGYFQQICQAVAYAHSKGVIHRDLKPSNIMVGAFGEVMVMDWGLAKVMPRAETERNLLPQTEPPGIRNEEDRAEIRTVRFDTGHETVTGSVMGTPAFMPPEQAAGEIDKLDERADVFGLGAILCVLLTGRPPYNASSFEAVWWMSLQGQLSDAYSRLEQFGIDEGLRGLCKACLIADRDNRLRDAQHLSAKLTEYTTRQEVQLKQQQFSDFATNTRSAISSETSRTIEQMKTRLEYAERELDDYEKQVSNLKWIYRRDLGVVISLAFVLILALLGLVFAEVSRRH